MIPISISFSSTAFQFAQFYLTMQSILIVVCSFQRMHIDLGLNFLVQEYFKRMKYFWTLVQYFDCIYYLFWTLVQYFDCIYYLFRTLLQYFDHIYYLIGTLVVDYDNICCLIHISLLLLEESQVHHNLIRLCGRN